MKIWIEQKLCRAKEIKSQQAIKTKKQTNQHYTKGYQNGNKNQWNVKQFSNQKPKWGNNKFNSKTNQSQNQNKNFNSNQKQTFGYNQGDNKNKNYNKNSKSFNKYDNKSNFYKKQDNKSKDAPTCHRCGHKSHKINKCVANKHINGEILPKLAKKTQNTNKKIQNIQTMSHIENEDLGVFLVESDDSESQGDICTLDDMDSDLDIMEHSYSFENMSSDFENDIDFSHRTSTPIQGQTSENSHDSSFISVDSDIMYEEFESQKYKKKNNKYYSQHHSLNHSISEDYDISVRKINLDNSATSRFIDYNTNNEHIYELLNDRRPRPDWLYETKL